MPPSVGVIAVGAGLAECAAELAEELALPTDADADVLLVLTQDRIECRVQRGDAVLVAANPTWIDLTAIDTASGPGRSLQNPMLKAVGIRKGDPTRPHVLDATGGFGEDAWLLAAAGCDVTVCERHPALFALLRDAIQRASITQPTIASHIAVRHADAIDVLAGFGDTPATPPATPPPFTVIYLDPMFRVHRKTAQRKPMRLAEMLLCDEPDDAPTLLAIALATSARRVVVKRPRKAPALPGPPPLTSHLGKALRFDVYRPAGLSHD